MPNKSINILIISILSGTSLFAKFHSKDTIYIYEEVTVYDTVIINDTIESERRTIPLENIKPKEGKSIYASIENHNFNGLKKNNNSKTATISKNSIIQLKNEKSMKKLFLIGSILVAMQNVFAQTEFEISLGGGPWFQTGNIDYTDKPISSLSSVGVYIKKYYANEKLALKTGFTFGYLFKPGSYSYNRATRVFAEKMEVYDLNQYYGLNYSYYSVPLMLYYNKYKLRPFLGINYNNIASQPYTISLDSARKRNISLNLGFNCGVEYRYSSFSAAISFVRNITKDYTANFYNGPTDRKDLYLRNNQIIFSISYIFLKKGPVAASEKKNEHEVKNENINY